MGHYTFRFYQEAADSEEAVDFLMALQADFHLKDRDSAEQIVARCFERGGIFGVYDGARLCGMSGFFYGEPEQDFANADEVGFMYVAGILPPYRGTHIFFQGLLVMLRHFEARGLRAFRLQARASDPYTNRLYNHFAPKVGESQSVRGDAVNTYGASVAQGLAFLMRRQRPSRAHSAPTPHHVPTVTVMGG